MPMDMAPHPTRDQPGREAGRPLPGLDQALPGLDQALPGLDQALPGLDQALPGLDQALPGLDQALPGTLGVSLAVRRPILAPSQTRGSYLRPATRSFIGMIALSVILMCSGHTSVQHLVMLQ
jgi:hypothetical protein